MALRGTHFIDRAAYQLNDQGNAQWSRAYLLDCLNEAQRAAVQVMPEVNPVVAAFELEAGALQSLPADAFKLLRITRNLGDDGQTPGRVITPCERETLDKRNPNWQEIPDGDALTAPECKNFIYDVTVRRNFHVFPAQPMGTERQIEIIYAGSPAPLADESAEITIDDIYEPVLFDHMLARAYARDIAAEGQGTAMADFYRGEFFDLLVGRADNADLTIRHETTERPAENP